MSHAATPAPPHPAPAHARPPAAGHTTGSLASLIGAELIGRADLPITAPSSLDDASPTTLAFIRDSRFAQAWPRSKAGAALVTHGVEVPGHDPSQRALLIVRDADLAMVQVLKLFEWAHHAPAPGVHPTAVVDPTARISPGARIGAQCVIGPRTVVGDGAVLDPRVTLGADVTIGPMTLLRPGVVVYDRCSIGAMCVLHGNVTIGADGFGYRPDPQGRGVVKIPHIGTVVIGNGVEIGANSAVDRGKFGATVVGDGTKLDNLVQIGHNVRIGRACLICAMGGIAGSVTIGDGVIIGGHCGVADAVTIGAGAVIGAKSGVICDVPPGEKWLGLPARPYHEQIRAWAATQKISEFMRRFKRDARSVD